MSQALKGGPETLAFLGQLPDKLANNVVRGGLRAGARVIAEAWKEETKSPQVAETIGVGTSTRGGLIKARVRAKGGAAFLAVFEEWGTLPHWISVRLDDRPTTRTRRGVRPVGIRTVNQMYRRGSLKIGDNFVGGTVFHPGARAHPAARIALDTKLGAAMDAMGEYMRKRMTKEGLNAPDFGADDEPFDA